MLVQSRFFITFSFLALSCERYQRDGFEHLASTHFGVWSALPKIIALTNSLNSQDKISIMSKLRESAPIFSFNRLVALYASCNNRQLISRKSTELSPLQLVDSSAAFVLDQLGQQ
mmetsp:Transcript_40360/g.108288  ORF Transcript_40360/g.108288 Transcript_40360/m.108288 type:complete len:115 (-) Transcript_40360:1772-2116(-)